jgi:E3 ubiquitin-protein ligase CCNP1IP1
MVSEQEALRRKNEELAQAYKDKSRKLLQTQELYDKAKRKAELGFIQRAASDAVDSTLSNTCTNQVDESGQTPYSDLHPSMPPPNVPPLFDGASMNTGIQRAGNHQGMDGGRWIRSSVPPRCKSLSPQVCEGRSSEPFYVQLQQYHSAIRPI